jgi:hypothetical protein
MHTSSSVPLLPELSSLCAHLPLILSVCLSLPLHSLSVHSLCVFLFFLFSWGLFCSDNNKFLQNSIAVVLVPASVQGNREIMTPQRRESGVLSSGRKETAAMGGRDLHAAAAAQPSRRSIHNTTSHSRSRRSTQAFTELGPRRCARIVENIPAAALAAPPARRSTHKFLHFYQNTSLYGAWQK